MKKKKKKTNNYKKKKIFLYDIINLIFIYTYLN